MFCCVIHGSFRKHFNLIQKTHQLFSQAGIEVLAPKLSEVQTFNKGFALLKGEEDQDPRLIELLYLHNLKRLGENGFSFFVNPEGYLGVSASYELGIAQLHNLKCFFLDSPADHPAYVHKNSIWSPEKLIEFIQTFNALPPAQIKRGEKKLHQLWQDLMVPGSVVAVGGIVEYVSSKGVKEILLVKTHKWGGRYSIVGGKVKRNEKLSEALFREVKEETGLRSEVGRHLCTFDQLKNTGYYLPGIQHVFVDNVVRVFSKRVTLNDEAQSYVWVSPSEALKSLEVEPNAKQTLQFYLS